MDSENPFILVLSGLPHLMDKLSLNNNRPLAQRILMRYKVEPLSKDKVYGYIVHHLELAGAKHTIFPILRSKPLPLFFKTFLHFGHLILTSA
jgi:general secretion pathway protein A